MRRILIRMPLMKASSSAYKFTLILSGLSIKSKFLFLNSIVTALFVIGSSYLAEWKSKFFLIRATIYWACLVYQGYQGHQN